MTDDIGYDDSVHVLYCARKILDFCELPEAASQILRSQSKLLGGIGIQTDAILAVLPPYDEVVMDFVGRHDELRALNEWLDTGGTRRWALSGEGGKGKSAIAYAFAKSVASRDDHGLEAIVWMSAKRRRFLEGALVFVDRPDFHDQTSAISAIILAFGETPGDDPEDNENLALSLLSDFPSLVIADDIDTVDPAGEDAIQFLVMKIPERTKSRVLVTSRRAIFGMGNLTTQITGLSPQDGEAFIKSRCDLMGIPPQPILAKQNKVLTVTDASPLFIEDLLRLTQSGLDVDFAIGLWEDKRGAEARKYAIQREYDQLSDDAQYALLALSLEGPCRDDDLIRGLEWTNSRLLDALQQLRKMFLMPSVDASKGRNVLALNNNTRALVQEVFKDSEACHRIQRMMQAASGQLRTKLSEDREVDMRLRRARLLVNQGRMEEGMTILQVVLDDFPGRADVYATLGWAHRRDKVYAEARRCFQRAHELGGKDRDAYWHWSEMEASNEEWTASAEAAELGLKKFPGDQGLLFRRGYALHRQGKEVARAIESSAGAEKCRRAQAVLEQALAARNSEDRNYSLRSQIYRAIVLNLEVLDAGDHLARYFAEWSAECPSDPNRTNDYARLQQKYPQFLRRH